MKNKQFLFIELNDVYIISLFKSLRDAFGGKNKSTGIHITIKGPQKSPFRTRSVNYFMEKKYPLLINGSGIFNNNGTYIVYMKVILDELKSYQLWYKPDFPEEFNPHITLYEGRNKQLANKICKFISKEINTISTCEYKIVPHTPSQKDLVTLCENKPNLGFLPLVKLGVVPDDIIQKSKKLVEKKLRSNSKRNTPYLEDKTIHNKPINLTA